MSDDFKKGKWISAIRDDSRFTPGEKYVLQNAVWTYNSDGSSELYARQDTVIARLGVSKTELKKAYRKAKEFGYFVLLEERQRGKTGVADRYRVQLPQQEVGADCGPTSSEYGHETPKVGARDGQSRGTAQTPDLQEPTLYKGLKRVGEGGARGRATQPPSVIPPAEENPIEPSPYCGAHPGGTNDKCGPCGAARRQHKAWIADKAARDRAQADARRKVIDACQRCRGTGQIDVDDNTVKRCECNPEPAAQPGAA